MKNLKCNNLNLTSLYVFYELIKINKKIYIQGIEKFVLTNMGLLLLDTDIKNFINEAKELLINLEIIEIKNEEITTKKNIKEKSFRNLIYKNRKMLENEDFLEEIVNYKKEENKLKSLKIKGKQKCP